MTTFLGSNTPSFMNTVPVVLVLTFGCTSHAFSQTDPNICKALHSQINGLQEALDRERGQLAEDICAGSARILCMRRIAFTSQDLQAAQKEFHQQCTPDGKPKPVDKATIFPSYYLITILYVPPGNTSEVKYGSGSSTGSRTEITTANELGVEIQLTSPVSELDATFQLGLKDGKTMELKKTTTTSLTLESKKDEIDHRKDTFYIWANSELQLTRVGPTGLNIVPAIRAGQSMVTIPLTAEELQNPSLIPDSKKGLLSNLKSSDYEAILSLDPFFSNGQFVNTPNIDPPRFVKVDTLQVDGPDHQDDPITGKEIGVSEEGTFGTISGESKKVDVTFLVGGDITFVVEFGFKAGSVFEWNYETTTERTVGSTQEIDATLKSDTVGYHDVIDVYEDTLFRSFMFISRKRGLLSNPSLLGTVTNLDGSPAVNQLVTVVLADGTKRRVFTNAKGIYRVFDIPTAKAQITVADQSRVLGDVTESRKVIDFPLPH